MEHLNISCGCLVFDNVHEFEKLKSHIQQFLCPQQPMRQLTLDVSAWK